MQEAVIAVLLAAVIIFAAYMTVKKLRRGGGCCGEHEAVQKGIAVKDRNKAHYPYSADLKISGMTCVNCAKRVENALNALDGVWAEVDLASGSAHVRMKDKTDDRSLCSAVAAAGYLAERM